MIILLVACSCTALCHAVFRPGALMAPAVAQTSLILLCRRHCDFQSPLPALCCRLRLGSMQEIGASGRCSSIREMMILEGSRLWHTAASKKEKAVWLLGWVSFLSVCGSLYLLAASVLAIRQRVYCASQARVQPQKEAILTLTPVQKSSSQCPM